MEFIGDARHISEWMSSRGATILVFELGKGNTWLLPYWHAEQKSGLLVIEELQVFSTWLKILVEGWPSLLCQTLGSTLETIIELQTELQDFFGWQLLIDMLEFEAKDLGVFLFRDAALGWGSVNKYRPLLSLSSNNTFFIVFSFIRQRLEWNSMNIYDYQ